MLIKPPPLEQFWVQQVLTHEHDQPVPLKSPFLLCVDICDFDISISIPLPSANAFFILSICVLVKRRENFPASWLCGGGGGGGWGRGGGLPIC